MLLNNTLCAVRIRVDQTFVLGSNDYERYDVVLNPCDLSCNDLMKTFSISIELQHRSYTIALVGSCLSCESDCAILEDNTLLMLLADVLVTIK